MYRPCKVPLGKKEKELGFVLYNYLYSRNKKDFTLPEIQEELLTNYKLKFSIEDLFKRTQDLIAANHVSQRVGYFTSYL